MSSRWLSILLPALVLAAGLAAYRDSFRGVFMLDDMYRIANSQTIGNPAAYLRGSTRPLADLSLHWNYRLSGVQPTDYHALNLAIHLAAALLLYGLVRRSVESGFVAGSLSGLAGPVAAFTALLWSLHPLQTQGVTYIVQRSARRCGHVAGSIAGWPRPGSSWPSCWRGRTIPRGRPGCRLAG